MTTAKIAVIGIVIWFALLLVLLFLGPGCTSQPRGNHESMHTINVTADANSTEEWITYRHPDAPVLKRGRRYRKVVFVESPITPNYDWANYPHKFFRWRPVGDPGTWECPEGFAGVGAGTDEDGNLIYLECEREGR
jgi:hypothetical protein